MTPQASAPDIDAAPGLTPVSLGQRVTFTWILKRYTEHRPIEGDRYGRTSRWKVWKNHSYPGMPEPAPQHGIIIGVRHLANGRAEYEHEVGVVWDPCDAERLTAYLVAFDLRRKPVLVLPEHLTIDQSEE
jgi:hypothetical protein